LLVVSSLCWPSFWTVSDGGAHLPVLPTVEKAGFDLIHLASHRAGGRDGANHAASGFNLFVLTRLTSAN
jgi:hypothetical protein